MWILDLTDQLCLHGDRYGSHGEEGEDRLVKAFILKQVSGKINREEVTLGAHVGHMPEGDISLTHDELTSPEHDAIYTWRVQKQDVGFISA